MGIEVIHIPPHYPQCKGKIERVIRTFNEEFLRICCVFYNPMALIPEFHSWYNDDRYHMAIFDFPNELYNNHFDVTYVT